MGVVGSGRGRGTVQASLGKIAHFSLITSSPLNAFFPRVPSSFFPIGPGNIRLPEPSGIFSIGSCKFVGKRIFIQREKGKN